MLTTAQGNGSESLKISKNQHTQTEHRNTLTGQREIYVPALSDQTVNTAQGEVKELINGLFNPIQILQALEEAQFLLVSRICSEGSNAHDLDNYRVFSEIKSSLGTNPILLTLSEQAAATQNQ